MAPISSLVSSAASLPASATVQIAKIEEAARGFERALMRQMLKELRESSFGTGQSLVSQGYAQIGDDHLADHLARAGGLGLARAMADPLIQQVKAAALINLPKMAV